MKKIFYAALFASALLAACNNQPNQAPQAQAPAITPADRELLDKAQGIFQPLPAVANNPQNPITEAKVVLGKHLYYDTRLSKTGNNSCNSCHNLATFGVDNLPTSKGDNGGFGDRNSPTVLNAALHTFQFWDGRAKDVEEQAGGPILNPAEMAMSSKAEVEKRLQEVPGYVDMFKKAFPNDNQPVVYANVQNAIAAFERTLLTPSPFDQYLNGNINALTAEQRSGLKQFINAGCIQCHTGSALGGTMFQKFGVHGDYRTFTHSKTDDPGKMKVSKDAADKDFFKVPGLRNIAKTYPYFHDGSVAKLEDAIKIMGKVQLNQDLSEAQVKAIASFLDALTSDVPADVKKLPDMLAQK